MKHTLGEFLKLKGSKSMTDYQLGMFGLVRKQATHGWCKRFKGKTLLEGKRWEDLVDSVSPSTYAYSDGRQKVYVVRNHYGHYKIGISKNIKSRMSELAVGSSDPLVVCRVYIPKFGAKATETNLHNHFDEHHRRGEWFNNTIKLEDIDAYLDLPESQILFKEGRDPSWIVA